MLFIWPVLYSTIWSLKSKSPVNTKIGVVASLEFCLLIIEWTFDLTCKWIKYELMYNSFEYMTNGVCVCAHEGLVDQLPVSISTTCHTKCVIIILWIITDVIMVIKCTQGQNSVVIVINQNFFFQIMCIVNLHLKVILNRSIHYIKKKSQNVWCVIGTTLY